MLSTTTVTHMLQHSWYYHHVGLWRPEVDVEHKYATVTHMLKHSLYYHHVGLRRLEVDVEHQTVTHMLQHIVDISSRGSAKTRSGCWAPLQSHICCNTGYTIITWVCSEIRSGCWVPVLSHISCNIIDIIITRVYGDRKWMLSTTTVTHMLQYRIQYHHVDLLRPEVDVEHHYNHTYAAIQVTLSSRGFVRRSEVDVEHQCCLTYAAIQYTISSCGSAETGSECWAPGQSHICLNIVDIIITWVCGDWKWLLNTALKSHICCNTGYNIITHGVRRPEVDVEYHYSHTVIQSGVTALCR